MVTALALSPAEIVLVGPLGFDRVGAHLRPRLTCSPWCPACRERHVVEFRLSPPYPADALLPLEMPCRPGSPLAGEPVWIGLDPDRREADLAIIRHYAERLRAWNRERTLAGAL